MAKSWENDPDWNPLSSIHGGVEISPNDGFKASDQNKIVENLQYLRNNSVATNLEVGTVTTKQVSAGTPANVKISGTAIPDTPDLRLNFEFDIPQGDPGLGDAILSNTEGDSQTNGFTQYAINKKILKSYYNLGAFDTYTSNDDNTDTVTRGTLHNSDGTQSQLPTAYKYTESVLKNQSINIATKTECLYWHDEFKKGLNLYSGDQDITQTITSYYTDTKLLKIEKAGYYTISYNLTRISGATSSSGGIGVGPGNTMTKDLGRFNFTVPRTVYVPEDYVGQNLIVRFYITGANLAATYTVKDIMLTYGKIPYPYEPYNGAIVYQGDLSLQEATVTLDVDLVASNSPFMEVDNIGMYHVQVQNALSENSYGLFGYFDIMHKVTEYLNLANLVNKEFMFSGTLQSVFERKNYIATSIKFITTTKAQVLYRRFLDE